MTEQSSPFFDPPTPEHANPVEVLEPGVYEMSANEYHADPVPGGSLSSTGARKLLPPSCPALYRHEIDNPPEPKAVYDLGHAAHKLVLGIGPEIHVVDAPDWRTKAARAARDKAHEAGQVPLLLDDYNRVMAMATALRNHPIASVLLDPERGKPEQSLFWRDLDHGLWCRARLDWLPEPPPVVGRLIVPEYKTCRSAAPDHVQKAIADYGYHQQAAWYVEGLRTLGLSGTAGAAFVFIFQEKDEPYLVTVAEPTNLAMRIGDALNARALDIYARCRAEKRWPGYSDDVELISLPTWLESRYVEEFQL